MKIEDEIVNLIEKNDCPKFVYFLGIEWLALFIFILVLMIDAFF